MFKVGDVVVHPAQGICRIESIQNDELSDKNRAVYVLKPNKPTPGNLRLLIPEEEIQSSGIHYPINESDIPSILEILKSRGKDLSKGREKGYRRTEEKIKKGDSFRIAEAIRDLEDQKNGKFSAIKEKLLDTAKKILVEEIAYVKSLSRDEAEELIDETLEKKGRRRNDKR